MSDLLVLCYHAVSPDWPAALSTTPATFEQHVALLSRRGYRGLPAREALAAPGGGRVVAITFDDAYRSVLELAKPILDRHGMRASVYVPTDWAGREEPMRWPGIDQWLGGPHERELTCMTWDQLGSLERDGWEVGSHTRSHPRLSRVEDDGALRDELEGSRRACEAALGRPCESIAYPYGDHDERVVEAAGRAGYRWGLTLPARIHAARDLAWPRVGIYRVDDGRRFRLKVSPAMRALRSSRLWPGG
ncbi:MAG TPA: polysaccharide deacetylase family protein [Thermoleophilaceae bacterium]